MYTKITYCILNCMSSRIMPNISFCFGVYNEEKSLLQNIQIIKEGLEKIVGKNGYEIVIVENGSTDNTFKLLKSINNKTIKVVSVPYKGLGLAFQTAISKAKNDNIVLSAVDLPFGFGDLVEACKHLEEFDIIYGSKAHPQSQIDRFWQRELSSFIYRKLLKLFFGVRINDCQGSVFFKKKTLLPILKYCDSQNAFFTAQLAIYGNLFGLKMTEIPVILKRQNRRSKFNILKDGADMLITMLKEWVKYEKIKSSLLNDTYEKSALTAVKKA